MVEVQVSGFRFQVSGFSFQASGFTLQEVVSQPCRPYRDSRCIDPFPGTAVPGFPIPPLRGWRIKGISSNSLIHAI
jgi:hypothetical protein